MKFPLQEFEDFLEPDLLDTGSTIYQEGGVEDVEKESDDEWSVLVSADDGEFDVYVTVEDGIVTDTRCNCDVEADFCAHIAATLYYLQAEEGEDEEDLEEIEKELDALLHGVGNDLIIDFILNYALRDKEFREEFMYEFGWEDDADHETEDDLKKIKIDLEEILNDASSEDILSYVISYAIDNRLFRDDLFAEFGSEVDVKE